jgi:integrase
MPQTEISIIESAQLDQNPARVYLASLKPNGRRAQLQALNVIANITGYPDCFTMPWAELRFQHMAAIKAKLAEKYKPATANRTLCALRGTMKAAWKLGQMTAEDYYRAADIGSVTGSSLPAGRELQQGELYALLRACAADPTPAGARDGAIIAMMHACGMRRDEVANLARENYDPETRRMLIKVAKRSKEREVYLNSGAAQALADWLAIRGDEPGPLFLAINKGGRIGSGMTNQAIYNALAKRAEQAKVNHFSPHDLRRTFVSDQLDAGTDIATVARMAGHSSINTTARYDRRPREAMRKAAEVVHTPYPGRG